MDSCENYMVHFREAEILLKEEIDLDDITFCESNDVITVKDESDEVVLDNSVVDGMTGDYFSDGSYQGEYILSKLVDDEVLAPDLRYFCYHCSHATKTFKILEKHIKMKHLNGAYYGGMCPHCNYCATSSTSKEAAVSNLKRHIFKKHKSREKNFSRFRLLKGGIPKGKLSDGMENGYSSAENKELSPGPWVFCYHCSHATTVLKELKRHIKKKHFRVFTKAGIYSGKMCPHCNYCPTSAISVNIANSNLKRHILEVHGAGNIMFFHCPHCTYTAKRMGEINRHMQSRHTKKQMFSCEVCTYSTPRRFRLNQHLFSKHSINKNYSKKLQHFCYKCDYSTWDKHNLNSHILYQHTEEKPHKCDFCDHRTKKLGDLNSHIKSVHTKEKEFSCQYCEYRAKRNFHLKIHIERVHFKSKPFSCPHCLYTGAFQQDIKSHIARRHKDIK